MHFGRVNIYPAKCFCTKRWRPLAASMLPSTWPCVSPWPCVLASGYKTHFLFSVYFTQFKGSETVWGLCRSVSALCFYSIKHRGCAAWPGDDQECKISWRTVQVQNCAVSITGLFVEVPGVSFPQNCTWGLI